MSLSSYKMNFRHSPKAQRPVHEVVVQALEKWVERHPNPDVPAMSIATSGQFTPRQLLHEIRDRSDTGLLLEEMIETAVVKQAVTLDELLSWFEGEEPNAVHDAPILRQI